MATVTSVALIGSLVSPLPFSRTLFTLLDGKERSPASACRVLGATRMEPMAEEKVEAASPSGIIKPPAMAISPITSWLVGSLSASGLADEGWGKGPSFGDVDHDGDLDLYEGDCKLANKLYLNDGTGVFTDVADTIPVLKNETVRTKGTAFADIDDDGDLDLYVVNWGVSNRLYRNEENNGNFLKVRLQGTVSNADAVGAKVTVVDGDKLIGFQEVRTLTGFCSQAPLELHFGLPAPGSYTVQVQFPSGLTATGSYQSGQSVVIVEGG